MIKNILKWRKESDTYLTHVCRHRWSKHSVGWKLLNHPLSLWSVRSSDVYRHESGRCHSLPFILKYFLSSFFIIIKFGSDSEPNSRWFAPPAGGRVSHFLHSQHPASANSYEELWMLGIVFQYSVHFWNIFKSALRAYERAKTPFLPNLTFYYPAVTSNAIYEWFVKHSNEVGHIVYKMCPL